jgi:hypothetical protein
MTNLKRKLLALAMMMCIVSAGAFAQKGRGEDKRPPKNPDTKVVERPKERPPQNNNQDKPKNDGRRGRP